MRAAVLLLAFSLPALAVEPCAPCPMRSSTCVSPACSNDDTTVGDECLTWNAADPAPGKSIDWYRVVPAGAETPCCVVPGTQLSATIAGSGCIALQPPGPNGEVVALGVVQVEAEQSDGLRSINRCNLVTFDAPLVCFGHYNCRTVIDPLTGRPDWVCDGCERRCSNLAPLYTALPVCL